MAKNVVFLVLALIFSGLSVSAQTSSVRLGSTLVLGKADANGYDHIQFPRKNFIIKRGAIADFNRLTGMEVIVEDVVERGDATLVTLKRADGGKFFRFFPEVTARLEAALESGELSRR